MGLGPCGLTGQGQVSDRDLAQAVRAGGGAWGITTRIAKGIELLDKAGSEIRLGRDKGPQRQLKGPVPFGIKGTKGQGQLALHPRGQHTEGGIPSGAKSHDHR